MNGLDDRMNIFDARLDRLQFEVGELRTEVGELRTEVRTLSARVDALGEDVSRLRILEDHTDQIRKIAEVQASHGDMLMELRVAILPLRELHELVPLLAKDHECRSARLETHTGLH